MDDQKTTYTKHHQTMFSVIPFGKRLQKTMEHHDAL